MFLIHCPKVYVKLAVSVKLETIQHQIISCISFKGVKFRFLLSGQCVLNVEKQLARYCYSANVSLELISIHCNIPLFILILRPPDTVFFLLQVRVIVHF